MDRTEEDMKNLGFFGIVNQSFKTIFKNTKIFAQITLSLLVPLTLIFIAHSQISHHLFYNIETSRISTFDDSDRYRDVSVTDWIYYWLFKIIYFTLLTIFSLLSTAAIVFTIASVYAGRDVAFRHVIKIVPRIWKKLFVTFVYIYMALFLYNVVYGVIAVILRAIFGYTTFSFVLLLVLLVLYLYGFLYLSVVWQLASVVTVLEDLNGFNAMKKGKILLYGKKKVGMPIAFVMYVLLLGIMIVLEVFVEYGDDVANLHVIWRVMIGILCALVLLIWFLLFIVMQTVLYLVCKSFHREAIDKLSLSTFLGAYAGEPLVLPNTSEEIQLGRTRASLVVCCQEYHSFVRLGVIKFDRIGRTGRHFSGVCNVVLQLHSHLPKKPQLIPGTIPNKLLQSLCCFRLSTALRSIAFTAI
ncbi:hypothetical protein CTI12_AA080420 [Artemisia annua]|uniref:Uncharacterized protein n=1 Tax=Artemisia annua TaxID=35608 RepID=A0A2U1Q307_ARTAN|nr:hypothetical protein CTI12_AA080420 [Artemisia annua]